MTQKTRNQVKREFDFFAQRVARLESLKHELDSLNIKGFEDEAKLIRARLKDIDAVPEIERDLGVLREKIKDRHHAHSDDNAKLKSLSESFKKDSDSIKRKIHDLEEEIEKRRKMAGSGISAKDKEYLKDVPKLESELNSLRKAFKEHATKTQMRIDTGIGVIVDTKFNDFLAGIKGELSEKLNEKKLAMNEELKREINENEEIFAEKYKHLVEEFHEKYKQKVDSELKEEVRENFAIMLNKRLDEEKVRIVRSLIHENVMRLAKQRKEMLHRLHEQYENKETSLKKSFSRELQKEKNKIDAKRNEIGKKAKKLNEKRNLLLNRERELHNSKLKIQKNLHSKERALIRELSGKRKKANLEINTEKQKVLTEERKLKREEDRLQAEEKRRIANQKDILRIKEQKLNALKKALQSKIVKGVKSVSEQKAELKKKYSDDEEKLKQKYENEKKMLDSLSNLKKNLRVKSSVLQKHVNSIKNKEASIKLHEKSIIKKEQKSEAKAKIYEKQQNEILDSLRKKEGELQKKFVREQLKINLDLEGAKRNYEFNVNKMKHDYDDKIIKIRRESELKVSSAVDKAKTELREELNKRTNAIKNEYERKLAVELRERERQMKDKFESDYESRLQTEMKKRAADMEKKKAVLESHIMEQARKLFK